MKYSIGGNTLATIQRKVNRKTFSNQQKRMDSTKNELRRLAKTFCRNVCHLGDRKYTVICLPLARGDVSSWLRDRFRDALRAELFKMHTTLNRQGRRFHYRRMGLVALREPVVDRAHWAQAEPIHVHFRPEATPILKERILEIAACGNTGVEWIYMTD